ncbi:MAG TPA: hypothetical protein VNZ54_01685, partial [bacterium]|nr:hypothetical protein [bacterium]
MTRTFLARHAKGLMASWLLCLVLLPHLGRAAGCQPVSATLTYSADDYFEFWINGNQIVNGTTFDAGNPPATVAIPVGDFAAAGTANYFAAQVNNSVANLIGATWLISITCADGS